MSEDSDILSAPAVSVRGHRAFNEPAKLEVRALAFLIDLAWACALFFFALRVFGLSPVPSVAFAGTLFAVAFALAWAQQAWLGGTLGQLIWRLRLLGRDKKRLRLTQNVWRATVYQHEHLTPSAVTTGIFLTIITLAGSVWVTREALWKHPLLIQAETTRLAPFVPGGQLEGQPEKQNDWSVLPFFYSLGAWPKHFDGHPIFFDLPYAKGPPTHFVGSIVARWEMPDITLTIEGPHTPVAHSSSDALRDCVIAPWNQPDRFFSCLHLREANLLKHIQEIRAIHPKEWSMSWIEVDNSAVLPEERPRGVLLRGWNETRAQDRFILINAKGAQQAFVLERPLSPRGEIARQVFESAIRSQRISGELNSGRAWTDRLIAQTKLEDLQAHAISGDFVSRLAEVQALLLSKISVDPKGVDAFFHLGGTALMLSRHAAEKRNELWTAAARPMVQSALRYAKDVAPGDSRTVQLENMWLEAKKY